MANTEQSILVEAVKKAWTLWIVFSTLLLSVRGSAHSFAGACPEHVTDVLSECLVTYTTKVSHMQRDGQNFYTGIDMEEMRSICSAMRRGIKCTSDAKNTCPDLEDPVYPSDLIAVYNLCHFPKFHEVYAINQFCYANVRVATESCFQRFKSQTEYDIPDSDAATQYYCSQFDILVNCIWAIVSSNCGEPAANLVESLVRPAVPYSDTCVQPEESTTVSTSTTEAQKLYRYNEGDNRGGSVDNQNNSQRIGNTANSLYLHTWFCLVVLLNTVFAFIR